MFSDHVETSPSITASVSAPSIACSMLAVQQQKRLCRQFAWNIGNRCQKVWDYIPACAVNTEGDEHIEENQSPRAEQQAQHNKWSRVLPCRRRRLGCRRTDPAATSTAQRRRQRTGCAATLLFGTAPSLRTVTSFWTTTFWCPDDHSASSSYNSHPSCNVRLPPVDDIRAVFELAVGRLSKAACGRNVCPLAMSWEKCTQSTGVLSTAVKFAR